MTIFRSMFIVLALACVLVSACGAEPRPAAISAAEYLAMVDRDPHVASVRLFAGPPIIANDRWLDDEGPRILRAALADSLAAMGFTIVGKEDDADAIARIRIAQNQQTQTPAYTLEISRGGMEIDSFRLEDDAMLSYEGLTKAERLKRTYTRMIAARAASITRSPRIVALADRRATDRAASAARPASPPKTDVAAKPTTPSNNDRLKAIAWMQSTNKNASAVATFTQQVDSVIDSGKDAQWQLGWGVTNDGMARVARWRAGSFETRSITPVEATQLGLVETSSTFTTHLRGSLAPLGPNSAPPPPTVAPPPPPPLPPNTETGKGRAAAVAWVNAHAKGAQTVSSLLEQIDDVIRTGTRGEWKIGWSLSQNGSAYFMSYSADGAFQVTELSVADAQSQGYKAYSVTYSKY